MDKDAWLLLALFIIGLVALIGFFVTKSTNLGGFGRFSTSAFLLLLVLIISSLLFAARCLDLHILSNILFAIIGFAGGLFTGRDGSTGKPIPPPNPAHQRGSAESPAKSD
ncbi:MAG: hypothetical protein DLM68_06945 [Hyphomicrobiales bacterium]|nr:MAG: hypothetical protein DLM68_06945 [Hyphomicrobiales bacterium]